MLEKYVFKIIPLLNPDGVARGYYRLDTHNHNLNRFYLDPCPYQQPTIYQAKKAVVQQHELGAARQHHHSWSTGMRQHVSQFVPLPVFVPLGEVK